MHLKKAIRKNESLHSGKRDCIFYGDKEAGIAAVGAKATETLFFAVFRH